jgi:hypothetical protein
VDSKGEANRLFKQGGAYVTRVATDPILIRL